MNTHRRQRGFGVLRQANIGMSAMTTSVRAKFTNGAIVPLEPLDFAEGDEILLTVNGDSREPPAGEAAPSAEDADQDGAEYAERTVEMEPNYSAGLSVMKMFEELRSAYPDETWDDLPADGATNYKHYLYGWPKEEKG